MIHSLQAVRSSPLVLSWITESHARTGCVYDASWTPGDLHHGQGSSARSFAARRLRSSIDSDKAR